MSQAIADTHAASGTARALPPVRGAWLGLVVLTLVNLFNYLDRFVVAALGESLRTSDLHLSDAQFGQLASVFIIVYMVAAPVIGARADRGSRPRLLALGVAIWSVATALGGLATSFGSLLAARAVVGVGEAAYGTIAPALLADYFPARLRGRVFAVFYMATPVGSALGYVVGGLVDHRYGWRSAFFVAGIPGLLLALLSLWLADPPRGARDEADDHAAVPAARGMGAYRVLARIRQYRLTILGYAAYTFALGGIAFWMPTFLERVRGLPREQASVQLGAVVVITGFVGTFVGGWLGDFLLARTRQAYLWVSGLATLAAAPLAYLALVSPDRAVYWPALIAAEVLIFMSTGPINSAIVSEVPAAMRASAMALSIFVIHVLGDVPSPWLIGKISDASSLGRAVLLIPAAVLVGALVWTWAALRPDSEPRRA
ncbi:MAG TPA: MFS transporter [Gemmatimonadaceae bacterium]|nr:MFS transporter [Gemmatimonadaceae bacterium]